MPLPFWPLDPGPDPARLLADDVGFGDLTTRVLGIGTLPGEIRFAARQELVLCGVEEAAAILLKLGATVLYSAGSGQTMAADAPVLHATGPASALHAGWKMAQLVMEFASGVASETAAILAAARAVNPRIAVTVTRKSIPFTRALSLKAVLAGGGEIHRLGLHDSIMIFPEHLAFVEGGVARAVAAARRAAPERAVMVEVTDEAGLAAAAAAGADVIQLEKFTPEAARRACTLPRRADGRPVLALAGGINAQNAASFAASGADTLVTSAPFYARPRDIAVTLRHSPAP